MNDIDTNQTTEQQPTTPTPEASGDQSSERMFTQEEVNRIVSERLNRERQKAEPSLEETREAELTARENRLTCKEYIVAEGFPEALLDLFPTTDAEAFKAAVAQLDAIVTLPSPKRPIPRFTTGYSNSGHGAPRDRNADLLQQAFAPPKI